MGFRAFPVCCSIPFLLTCRPPLPSSIVTTTCATCSYPEHPLVSFPLLTCPYQQSHLDDTGTRASSTISVLAKPIHRKLPAPWRTSCIYTPPLAPLSPSLAQLFSPDSINNPPSLLKQPCKMQARDAAGRQVSLLNDDSQSQPRPVHRPGPSPLLSTPELLRADSYDSNASSIDAISPLTPGHDYAASRPLHDDYMSDKQFHVERPAYVQSSRSNSYEDDGTGASTGHERAGKRYPCRYRDSHGCAKTFTTSGHASRHSKIHTAEKAVQCTYNGCHKKFTRADNMKQHLETHYKDKSRSGASKSSKPSYASKRGSISRTNSSPQGHSGSRDVHMWNSDAFYDSQPLPSPSNGGPWDMRGLNLPLMSRPCTSRTSSGLDALAAIACQEGQ